MRSDVCCSSGVPSFVDSLMDPCAWITAFAIPRSPRRSPPNGRARCAPRSSRGWRPITQSTDNEVGALLSRPTEVDRPTICQLDRNKEGLLVSLQRPSSHFGADAFRCGCTLGMHGLLGWLRFLWMRFSQIDIEERPVSFVGVFLFHGCYLLFCLIVWVGLVVICACPCCSRRRRMRLTWNSLRSLHPW